MPKNIILASWSLAHASNRDQSLRFFFFPPSLFFILSAKRAFRMIYLRSLNSSSRVRRGRLYWSDRESVSCVSRTRVDVAFETCVCPDCLIYLSIPHILVILRVVLTCDYPSAFAVSARFFYVMWHHDEFFYHPSFQRFFFIDIAHIYVALRCNAAVANFSSFFSLLFFLIFENSKFNTSQSTEITFKNFSYFNSISWK